MTPPKKIYGLIGYPVKHSLSPAMHNAAFKALGIDAEYRLFEVKPEELKDFLLNLDTIVKDTKGNSIRAGDVVGFNITIPHKVKAREILEAKFPFDKDALFIHSELFYVKLSGAVNTVKRNWDRLEYWNTDAPGFIKSLEEDLGFDTKDKNILLIGCGGGGRAVVSGLSWKQMRINKIYVYDISQEVVNSAKEHFSKATPYLKDFSANKIEFISEEQIPKIIKNCQLLVDASGVGLKKEDISVIDKGLFHKDLFVYDLVYNRETRLIREAKSLGLRAEDGLGMLLYQGAFAFGLWTGRQAPVEVMRKVLFKQIGK